MEEEEVALIDFCGTVVDFQSFNPFLELVLRNEKPVVFHLICNKISKHIFELIQKVAFKVGYEGYVYKRLLVKASKNVPYMKFDDYAKEYYNKTIKQHLIFETIQLIKKLKKEGYKLIVLSGGCDLYINLFVEEFGLDGVVATQIMFDEEGESKGKYNDVDCLGKNKILQFQKSAFGHLITAVRVSVSDSNTDMPMLNLAERKIVISKNKHQLWVTKEMEEIVWES